MTDLKKYLLILFVLAFSLSRDAYAQEEATPASVLADSLINAMNNAGENEKVSSGPDQQRIYLNDSIQQHKFNKAEWKKITKDLDYTEEKEKPKEKPKDPDPKNQPHYSTPPVSGAGWLSSGAAQTILIVLAAVALAFIMFKLFSGRISNTKVGNEKIYTLENIEEALHETDLERFLQEAIELREFRLALRIYYLMVLKELSVKEWIKWKKDKTNNQYLNEMFNRPDYKLFRNITLLFEYTWYGEMSVGEKHFNEYAPSFRSYLEKIKNTEQA